MPIVDVPGHGSVDFPDSMSGDQIGKAIQKLGISSANPSDSIPKSKAPIPTELQGPAPSRFKQVMSNIPGGILRSGESLLKGPSMGGVSRDSQGNIDMNAGLHPLIDSFKQRSFKPLLDAATEDPVQALQNVQGLFHGGKDIGENTATVPVLKGAASGAKAALTDSIPITRYGHTLNLPKPLAGMAAGEAMGYGFKALTPHAPEIGAAMGAVAPVIKGAYEGGKTALSDYKTSQIKPVTRIPSAIPDVSKTPDMPVGPVPRPVLPSGRRVPNAAPETRPVQAPSAEATQVPTTAPAPPSASRHVARNVIKDENGEPVAYDTPAPDHNIPAEEGRAPKTENPMDRPYQEMQNRRATDANQEPQDVFDKIAAEGTAKRASDARAKYEDVYQNVIKGNYTPEELRNLTPETKTALDLKIRDMRHGDESLQAGKKKYGTGLNPTVTESLAQRLESESPQATPDQAGPPTN